MEVKKLMYPKRMKLGYFFGKFGISLFCSMEMYYFASYCTDKARLPLTMVAICLNVPTVIDTIFSFLNGAIIEKLPHPGGKYTFWMIIGPIVGVICYTITYIRVPGDWACTLVITITLIIAHFFWSIAENCYTALPAVLTEDAKERGTLSVLGATSASWSGFLFGLISLPVINWFNSKVGSDTHGYAFMTAFGGIIFAIAYIFLAVTIRKQEKLDEEMQRAGLKKEEKVKGPTLKEMLSNVVGNKPLLILMLFGLLQWTASFSASGMMFYFFNCSMGAVAMMSVYMSARSIGGMCAVVMYPIWTRICKGRKRNITAICMTINACYQLVIWAIRPPAIVFIVGNTILAFAVGVSQMPLIAMYSDAATYGEWKTGVNCRAFVMSMYNIPLKLGLLIKGVVISVILGVIRYDAALPPETFKNAFYNGYLLLMAVLNLCAVLILVLGFKLKEDQVTQMALEIQERNQAKIAAAEAEAATAE